MGKLAIKLWNYLLKGRKFEQSCISDRLSVSADISDPLSVIGISAKFHIGASLVVGDSFVHPVQKFTIDSDGIVILQFESSPEPEGIS